MIVEGFVLHIRRSNGLVWLHYVYSSRVSQAMFFARAFFASSDVVSVLVVDFNGNIYGSYGDT